MATISIFNLHATGTDLFTDSESYLSELTDAELNDTKGGSAISVGAFTAGVIIGVAITIRIAKEVC